MDCDWTLINCAIRFKCIRSTSNRMQYTPVSLHISRDFNEVFHVDLAKMRQFEMFCERTRLLSIYKKYTWSTMAWDRV